MIYRRFSNFIRPANQLKIFGWYPFLYLLRFLDVLLVESFFHDGTFRFVIFVAEIKAGSSCENGNEYWGIECVVVVASWNMEINHKSQKEIFKSESILRWCTYCMFVACVRTSGFLSLHQEGNLLSWQRILDEKFLYRLSLFGPNAFIIGGTYCSERMVFWKRTPPSFWG